MPAEGNRVVACLDESTALTFASGRMEGAPRARAVRHLVSCRACRALVVLGRAPGTSAPAGPSLEPSATALMDGLFMPARRSTPADGPAEGASTLERGTIVGRYTILELVGRGGMGEVYAAYDPKLDRRIALKLLRTAHVAPDSSGEARLLREAQAIAKVSHPNVVTIHDVGTHGDRVFLAMEFLDGATLKDWLATAPRTRRQIVDVFKAAARGLVAAHAAGLIHRDFKPQNVMVTPDGAVRVMDFGLVRQVDDLTAGGEGEAGPRTWGDDVELTRTGDMVGTPRYMAPEQFKAEPVSTRTDQFSFCVALYEALYAQRPFDGLTLPMLVANVIGGHVVVPPAKAGVPSWLRRVVLRGLEVDPARRFPSMTALLEELADDPTARRRRLALGAGLLASLAAAILGARHFAIVPSVTCGSGLPRWAGVWTPGAVTMRSEAIHGAFASSGKAYAEQAFRGAARGLDEYARRWLGLYTDACEAHARGEQSADVLDLRMSCLDERLTRARALTDLFAHADGEVVANALAATSALPSLDRCGDVTILKAIVRPPESEGLRRRVDALRGEVAHLAALRDGGHCVDAERLAEDLIARVRATAYLPLLADVLTVAGTLGNTCADNKVTIARYEEAYTVAVAAHDDETAALAALAAGGFSITRGGRIDVGRTWLDIARATLQRVPGHPLLEAWYQTSLGSQLAAEGRLPEALEAIRTSGAARKKQLGAESLDAIMVSNNLGITLTQAGRPGDAIVELERSEDLARRILGVGHPMLALLLGNEGEALNAVHDYAKALGCFDEAIGLWKASGAAPGYLRFGLAGRGLALLGEGQPLDALAPLEEALRIAGADHDSPADVAETRALLARALWARPAARPRARALADEARLEYASAGASDKAKSVAAWLAAPTAKL
jgi:eukaryotic-like serine/threonine-protein kinase